MLLGVNAPDAYPVLDMLPDPIRISNGLTPVVLTALNITVTRLAQLGIPVKSMAVPLVETVAVPMVNGCDSLAGVIDPSAGVDENVPLVADVILPFASTVKNGIADALPYVPAVTPVVPSVPVPELIVKSPARVVERLPIVPVVLFKVAIVPVVLFNVAIVPVVLFNVAIVPVVLAKLVIVPLVIVAAVEVVVPNVAVDEVSVGITPVVIVPVVIVALVETNLVPVAVP